MTEAQDRFELLSKYSETAYWYIERHCHDDVEPAQAKQRDITRWSFEVVRGARPDVQPFTNLLIQFPAGDNEAPDWIAPDNSVFVHAAPLDIGNSFDIPFQPVRPFFVLEYLTEANRRRIQENYELCERKLEIRYYLRFDFNASTLELFKLDGGKYSTILPNAFGRYAIPELELEVALLDKWVRYWFRGELVPLPGDLLKERDAERKARQAAEAELAKLRDELAKAKEQD